MILKLNPNKAPTSQCSGWKRNQDDYDEESKDELFWCHEAHTDGCLMEVATALYLAFPFFLPLLQLEEQNGERNKAT